MTAANTLNMTSPVGRIVWGDMYAPNTTDYQNQPLVVKTGPNKGQARVDYAFGLAIPKTAAAWWDEPWGKQVLAVGAASFPQQYQSPQFAWKITDGDSQVPNKNNRKPADQEGFKGHWVLRLGSSFAPTLVSLVQSTDGRTRDLLEKNAILPGYFVQVNFDVAGNNQPQNPGIYLNHRIVCLMGFGAVIRTGPDPNAVGFGQGAVLPAGASATPPAGFTPAAPAAAPGMAPAPAMAPVAPAAAPMAPMAPMAPAAPMAPVMVAPAPVAALAPVAPVAMAPMAPVAPAAPQMTAKAGGATYESFIQGGWTPEMMRQQGYLI